MALSLDEIVSVMILLVPGFLSMTIGINCYGFTRKLTKFDKTVWSISLSGCVDFVFFLTNGLFDQVGEEGFGAQLSDAVVSVSGLLQIFFLSIIFGFIVAFILRLDILEYAGRFVHYKSRKGRRTRKPLWLRFLSAGSYVIVESHEVFYQGWIWGYSTEEEENELVLMDPMIVEWDEKGDPIMEPFGRSIWLSGKDISNIVLIEMESEY